MKVLTALFVSAEALSQYPAPFVGGGWQSSWNQPSYGVAYQPPFAYAVGPQGPAASQWTPAPDSQWTPSSTASKPGSNTPSRLPSQTLAERSPSEQLQITKCRSGQSCEKCRQLNCFWDASAKITSRCIALGLESSSTSVGQGVSSKLAQCPAYGQSGSIGVNWLAIEASGAQVPKLDGMSDSDIQRWISGLSNYRPDASDVNYPAGSAFRELLPNAADATAAGQIPSTTPWISFWDTLTSGYGYDEPQFYDDSGYGYPGFGGNVPPYASWNPYPYGGDFAPSFPPYPSDPFPAPFSNSLPLAPFSSGPAFPPVNPFSQPFNYPPIGR